jgi:hypothetical protein
MRVKCWELLYKETPIGNITITRHDFPWTYGIFSKYAEFEKYNTFFQILVSENSNDNDLKRFDEELFNENNWHLKNEGEIVGIDIPAIYEDNEIGFRYRL